MKIDPTQSVKNQVKNYVKIQEGLEHSLPFHLHHKSSLAKSPQSVVHGP